MLTLEKISITFVTSLAVTLFVLPHLAHIADRIGLMDHPGDRKVHRNPKPLVGGLGMVIGLAFSSFLFIPLTNLRGFYAGVITLLIVGFFDDFSEISHRWKFVAQIVAAVLAIYFSDTVLRSFGNLLGFGPITFGPLAIPVTVFCIVGVINALNMIDGLDGLAGGLSVIAFISFAVLSAINGQQSLVLLSLAFAGALAGFLRHNWYPAKLFMGDAGSLLLGFALVFLAISIAQKEGSVVPPMAPLLVLGVPIVDTVAIMTKRTLSGMSPFHPDKNHIHHIILHMGYCKQEATKVLYLITAGLSLIGILGTLARIPDYILFLLFLIYAAAHVYISFRMKELVHEAPAILSGEKHHAIKAVLTRLFYRIDAATGLLNQDGLYRNLQCECSLLSKSTMTLALLLCAVAGSADKEERAGQTEQDLSFRNLSDLLRTSVRKTDIVGRLSGNEFMVIAPNTSRKGAEALAEKIRSLALKSAAGPEGSSIPDNPLIFGIASADKNAADDQSLLVRAREELAGKRYSKESS